jgi:undecaprenyl-diphosphatase
MTTEPLTAVLRQRLVVPGLLLILAGTAAIAGLADDASESDGLATFDPDLTADIAAHRSPLLSQAARALSLIGDVPVLTLLTLVVAGILWSRTRSWRTPGLVLVAMAGSALLTYGLKVLVGRHRPGSAFVLGTIDTSYSFPSGHTLNSVVFLGVVAGLAWATLTSTAARLAVVATATMLAAGVGASRIYLGYHWATDVLAGWLVGLTWLCVVGTAYLTRFREPPES